MDAMPSSRFTQWLGYFGNEPFGVFRDNYHSATIASILANVHSKKRYNLSDFFFKSESESKRERLQKFKAFIRGLATASKAEKLEQELEKTPD